MPSPALLSVSAPQPRAGRRDGSGGDQSSPHSDAKSPITAPLCQADAGKRGVAFSWGPGCGLTEEPAFGVEPVTLVLGVVPTCPPGPR